MQVERISWIGSLVVFASALPALFLLVSPTLDVQLSSPGERTTSSVLPHQSMDLTLNSDLRTPVSGAFEEQISFSFDPARPGAKHASTRFLIRLKASRQTKHVEVDPLARVGLAFDASGILQFSEDFSFWLECHLANDRMITATLYYRTPTGDVVTHAEWHPTLIDTPVQSAEEFSHDHPFRELAEGRWWGPDLLMSRARAGEPIQRIEIGPASNSRLIDCKTGDWLLFDGKAWVHSAPPSESQNVPIAHIVTATSQILEIEGWNENSHVRLRLNLAASPPLRIKTEELFSQLRVRSEKQISCMMDKQCLVLRPGDWVLKTGGRWKMLRKVEEKEALLAGEVMGDVFILEKIGISPTVKNISGSYFSAGRTQTTNVEVAQRAQKGRKASR